MYNISVLDKVKKSGIVSIDCPEGRFQHELDYQEASSPRSDRSLVLDLAPPLYYPSSKIRVYDRSPYRNIGTIIGPIFERLWTGLWLLRYDGIDDVTEIPNHASLSGFTEFTLACSFKTTITAVGRLISKWTGPGYYELRVLADGTVELRIYDAANNPFVISTEALNDDVWHRVYALTTTKLYLYVDGSYNNEAANTAGAIITDAVLRIGKYQGISEPFGGLIALLRIYNRISPLYEEERHLIGA